VVRQEPLGVKVAGGSGVRVLYRTQRADGSYTFSSGMVPFLHTYAMFFFLIPVGMKLASRSTDSE